MFPASGIFSARGHDGNQRRHAKEHEKEDDGSLVPDLTSAQDWYQRKQQYGKCQNKMSENSEKLGTIGRKESVGQSIAAQGSFFQNQIKL